MSQSKEQRTDSTLKVVVGSLLAVTVASLVACTWHYYKCSRQKRISKSKPFEENDYDSTLSPLLTKQFQDACQRCHSWQEEQRLSNGDQLLLYGLYKQSTEGDLVKAPPSLLNVVATAKYQAWKHFLHMPRNVAMIHYITAIKEMELDDHDESMENTTMGLKPSCMIHEPVVALDASATAEEKLRRAASCGEYDTIMAILSNQNNSVDINEPDESGQTALHFCADRGHLEGLQFLLQHGAKVDAVDHDGISVLHGAVISGHVHICRVLLQHGANPNHEDVDGDSPMSCAEGCPEIMALLQEYNPIKV